MPGSRAAEVFQNYAFHTMLIQRFIDGVTHDESLLTLPFQHNTLNWILGHIVTNRSHVLETAGIEHGWSERVRSLYHTETPNVTAETDSVTIDDLGNYLAESDTLLKPVLEGMGDEVLDSAHTNYRGEKSRHEHLTGFHWHEAFHLGQLEILRAFIDSNR